MKPFDIAAFSDTLMVVVESETLPPDPAVVFIPLLSNYPAVKFLNPEISFDDQQLVLATRLITSVRRRQIHVVGTATHHRNDIIRAIDVLLGGF